MIKIIKIGGNVIDNPERLKEFLKNFSALKGDKILIHGGGKEATKLSERLGVETKMIEGRRITDAATIDIVTMVYAGLINKRIVSSLQSFGCDALGLTGADGNIIKAKLRPPVPINYGFVGDINPSDINTPLILNFLNLGLTPVFCAITHNGEGALLNCNADTIASSIAIALSSFTEVKLTFCFEKHGVMTDLNDENSVIPFVTNKNFQSLLDSGVISGGMIPKVKNALDAISKGVLEVRICNDSDINGEGGTIIKNE